MNRNEKTLETLLNNLRDIRLTDEVRTSMRTDLLAYASLHETSTTTRMSSRSPFSVFQFRLYAGLASVLLIVVMLGGTAYASETALPGDALYTVKVGIAEPLQTALIPSDQGRAAWHAILAERRLDETAQLAARGTLSTTTQAELAANFDTQVSASEESANRLEHAGNTTGSLSVRSDLEARLSAHAQILAVLDAHFAEATSTEAENTHTALQTMLALVADHQQDIISARLALEDAIAPDSANAEASTTAKVAIATHTPGRFHMNQALTPAMQVENATAVRTEEEQHILDRHASFLAKFMPTATTTATTTVTTTATSTSTTTEETTTTSNGSAAGDEENLQP